MSESQVVIVSQLKQLSATNPEVVIYYLPDMRGDGRGADHCVDQVVDMNRGDSRKRYIIIDQAVEPVSSYDVEPGAVLERLHIGGAQRICNVVGQAAERCRPVLPGGGIDHHYFVVRILCRECIIRRKSVEAVRPATDDQPPWPGLRERKRM